jgi:alpha-beta hydrolase superfamily lysophospholipase
MEERTFVDAHGVEMFTRWWAVDEPRGLVVVSHGASEHSGRYDRFARALAAEGFATVALDHRGHGRSRSSTGIGLMGPGGGMALVDDLHELRTAAEAAVGPDVPVFLFAHSLGTLIGLAYLTHHADGLAGAVLCGMPAGIDDAAAVGALLRDIAGESSRDEPVADLLGNYNAAFEPARTRSDWLSRDPHEVDLYVDDPFCGDDNPLTYGYLIDLLDVVAPARAQLGAISCPVLVIAGDHDSSGAMGTHPTALADALRTDGVEVGLRLYEGARHELLNETNRDEVTADVIEWLAARIEAPAVTPGR